MGSIQGIKRVKLEIVFIILVVACWPLLSMAQPPKIGLTLSGGGAKGIAHIGVLKAIDSAGLRIDYVTGTSMGSIMGALYAAGYNGKDIERIARELDWTSLFTGKPSLKTVNINEKKELESFALQIPVEKGKFKIFSGAIEGQEIWLKFQELFLPVYNIKDFNKLSIPFMCVATDLATGQPVLLDNGELVSAIRASMAIPSIFTPIAYKDTKLVDGGVVRNFPVRDVKRMGADYVIGVNLSQGLLTAAELNTAIDILYQIGFYKDADDFGDEKKACNILIEPKVQAFSAASFDSVDSLLMIGDEAGKKYYPIFKRMADSLRAIYPDYGAKLNRLPTLTKITIDSIQIDGLHHTSKTAFLNRLKLKSGGEYDGRDVAAGIRQVYGTLDYNKITYNWVPTSAGHANLLMSVEEKPLTTFKVGIHYHSFSEFAVLLGVTSKNLFFDRSKTSLKLNLSENFRVKFEQEQAFGKGENNNFVISAYHERFKFPIYDDFVQVSLYRSRYAYIDGKLQRTFGLDKALGVGTSYEYFKLRPKIYSDLDVEGTNRYLHTYAYYKYNSLDKKYFSTQGWNVLAEFGVFYNQSPKNFAVLTDTAEIAINDLSFDPYQQLRINVENFHPLSTKWTLMSQFNSGMNFNYKHGYLNFFNVGGLLNFLRNQITFAGLNEYQVNTNSVSNLMVGLQYQWMKSVYATLQVNGALYNYIEFNGAAFQTPDYLAGVSLSLGYNSAFGPMSVSGMYSPQNDQVEVYLNIGFPF